MDKFANEYCRKEEKVSKEQFLMDIYLLLKDNYIEKTHNNGEYVTVKLLNGQVFKLKVFEE